VSADQAARVPASSTSTGGVWAPDRRALTVGLVLAVTLVAFEALAIATVLPVVSRQLGDLRLYGWVFSAFLLASLVGIVLAGTLADRVPLGRPMLAGLVFFALGLVVGGTAPDMPVLVLGRAIQGLGAGVVPAVAYVAISRGYPQGCRPRMFAVLSTAWVMPGLIGPAVAALVATAVGWRWVFLGLLPLVAATGVLAVLALKHVPPPAGADRASRPGRPGRADRASRPGRADRASRPGRADRASRPGRADRAIRADRPAVPYLPVLGVVAGAGLALAAVSSGNLPALAGGVVVGGTLLAVSLRRLTPPRTLTAGRGLPATILSRGLLTCCFFAGDAYVPYAITAVRHAPTALAALALTATTMTWTAGSWVQARCVARFGPRRLVRLGEGLVLAGLGLMCAILLPSAPPWFGVLAWAVAGGGMGLAYAPLSVTALDRAPEGEEGRVTSGLQLCDVLGQALGTGVAGAIVAAAAGGPGHRSGVALAFSFGIAISVLALAAGVRLPQRLTGPERAQAAARPG
jgi:MFS family permease